jgi:hypothetical protein
MLVALFSLTLLMAVNAQQKEVTFFLERDVEQKIVSELVCRAMLLV